MKQEVLKLLLKAALFLAALLVLFTLVFRIKRVEGNTMSPFLRDGDLCLFLHTTSVSQGDVVLYEDAEGTLKIGRVAAAGGQTVDFPGNGGYTVDGYETSEEVPYETFVDDTSTVRYPLTLEQDQLFILNDFRTIADDSRAFGPINRSQIRGSCFLLFRRRGF